MRVERSACATATSAEADADAARAAPLFIVINPGSGAHAAAQTRELLARVFDEGRRHAQFVHIPAPGDLARACDRAAAQACHEQGILVVAGGDGTINTAAQAALVHGCPLGVIPQGTFNFLAREHGVPVDVEAAARALLGASPTPVQAGLVNDRIFLVNASLGLYPQLLQDREAFNERFGRQRWVAVLSGLATLFKWRRQMVLDIELDGRRAVLVTPTLFVANNRLQMERVGMEEAVAASVGRGRLAGMATPPIGSWAMLVLLLRGALGRLGEADQVRCFSFHSLDVRIRGKRRVKVATDGEVSMMAPPLRFSVAPEPLLLMVPAQEDRAVRE